MARSLYRVYLYLVSVVMLGFAAFSVGSLLNTLLLLTPIRGSFETPPSGTTLVQSTVLALVALVIALGLGGLHYWLIRRDIAQDPNAAHGAVRSLALSVVQVASALTALFAGSSALSQLGRPETYGIATGVATTITALAVFALGQFERQRAQPAPGAPVVLQRLHLYGVQTVILVAASIAVVNAVRTTVPVILANVGAISNACGPTPFLPAGEPVPPQAYTCDIAYALLGDWLVVAWTVIAWAFYAWLARGDTRSVLRLIAHFLGFVVGLVSTVVGLEQVAELLLRGAFGAGPITAEDLAFQRDFLPALVLGLLLVFGYGLRLSMEARSTTLGSAGTSLTALTLSAVVFGVPFYVGFAQVAHGALEAVAPGGSTFDAATWATAVSWVVAGILHPLLAYRLRQRTTPEAPIGPRRALVLAGLAGGALVAAIAGATALYLVITASLGARTGTDWPVQARLAAAIAVVGAYVAAIHLWRLLGERKLIPRAVPRPAEPEAAATSGQIEPILDDLLAGRITRDQAVTQLSALISAKR